MIYEDIAYDDGILAIDEGDIYHEGYVYPQEIDDLLWWAKEEL